MAASGSVISIRGGEVEDVYCDDGDTRVLVVDWDVELCEPGKRGVVAVLVGDEARNVRVSKPYIQPLYQLVGSDVEAAIDTAMESGVLDDVFA